MPKPCFHVRPNTTGIASDRRWLVVCRGGMNAASQVEVPIIASSEELFAEATAARLNEAYLESFAELDYLVSVGRSILDNGSETSAPPSHA